MFVNGRVSDDDDNASKLICESIIPFDQTRCELRIYFADKEHYLKEEEKMYELLSESDGNDNVVIVLCKERQMKRLPANRNVQVNKNLLSTLHKQFGEACVKVVAKPIEMK